jgi:hypothetical protein
MLILAALSKDTTLELIESRTLSCLCNLKSIEEFVSLACQDMKEIQGLDWNNPELTLSLRIFSEMGTAD